MSGIVGIINLDGAPVNRELLWRMTDFMSYRGPDAQEIWIDGNVGFGHTMLRTTFEAETEKQPLTLDGQVWLIADARIDGRAELIRELEAKLGTKLRISARSNGHDSKIPNDAELILYSYEVWGEDCIKHLIGDFAFAIWDRRERRLFCARDHFGVKPFYYVHLGKVFIFGNTLNCVRLHPDVSDELNSLAIGDFLMFGFNHEVTTTTFADIQRLPAGHSLRCSSSASCLKRYWNLPNDGYIRYRRASDYVDHFRDLLRATTEDRLRTEHVAIFMSGGLDSTTVAATAHERLSQGAKSFDLQAYTIVHEKLFHDEERYYSQLVADTLGMTIGFLIADDYILYDGWERPEIRKPEPSETPLPVMAFDQLCQVTGQSRVVLTGYGADPALCPSQSHGIDTLKRLEFKRLGKDIGWFIISRRQLPRLGFRGSLKRGLLKKSEGPLFPVWLNQDFVATANLRERWRQINNGPVTVHPRRPQGYRSLTDPFWPDRFESYDPGITYVPSEVRHPFFDSRLMTYLLAIPAVPWCIEKELLRKAMHGSLPEPVRLRPKALLAGDPVLERVRRHNMQWIDHFEPCSELSNYVDRNSIPRIADEKSPDQLWRNIRPFCLNLWLKCARCKIQLGEEAYHEHRG